VQLRLHGGGPSQERTRLRLISLLTGKNTGNFGQINGLWLGKTACKSVMYGSLRSRGERRALS
jgi:hypothetical protein